MIKGTDFYHVMTAVVPLYVAMILAYGSVRWWKVFSPEQCSGINRFVALFAVPLLSFHFISTNNPYEMNLRFVAADTLQKMIVLAVLAAWCGLSRRGSLDWVITVFSLATLPNTLVMGIPLLRGMYGAYSGGLMVQIVVLQCIIWYTLLLFMFEYRAARALIAEQFPDTAGAIASITVDSDVTSLDGSGDALQTEAEIMEDGKLHVTVRRSNASRSDLFYPRRSVEFTGATPRSSNLSNAEIYSMQSSRNPTPRGSSFNHSDFYSMFGRSSNFGSNDVVHGTRTAATPRPSNYEDEHPAGNAAAKSKTTNLQLPVFSAAATKTVPAEAATGTAIGQLPLFKSEDGGSAAMDLHMFVWSSSTSPVSDAHGLPAAIPLANRKMDGGTKEDTEGGDGGGDERHEQVHDGASKAGPMQAAAAAAMPPTSVMTRLILIMVWRKLIRNPNTYSSVIGVVWSLICFRWHFDMPDIITHSISILSDAGLGMAMFSLGLFMALQPRIIACGNSTAAFAMAVRFLTGPAVMAAASIAVGLRGDLLRIGIVQAVLPQGIVPFVFAKEYNLHPDILSTAVIFGMLIALPITFVYYILLGL